MKLILIMLVAWFPITIIMNFALYEKMKGDRFARLLAAAILAALVIVFYPLVILGGLIYIVYRIDKRCNPDAADKQCKPEQTNAVNGD